jgi:hypothetical protein
MSSTDRIRPVATAAFLLLASAGTLSASGWMYAFQPIEFGLAAGGVSETMTDYYSQPPKTSSWTGGGLVVSGRLLSAAIGRQFDDRVGAALGTQLLEVDVTDAWTRSSPGSQVLPHFSVLNPELSITYRLGDPYDALGPMLVGTVGAGLTALYVLPGMRATAGIGYEWSWGPARPGMALKYVSSEVGFALDMQGAVYDDQILSLGFTLRFDRWHAFGGSDLYGE